VYITTENRCYFRYYFPVEIIAVFLADKYYINIYTLHQMASETNTGETPQIDFSESTDITAGSNNQGVVRSCMINGEKKVWKVSQGYDFVVDHEVQVMEELAPLKSCCPNFMYCDRVLTVNRKEIPVDMYESVEPINVPMTVVLMDCVQDSDGNPARTLTDLEMNSALDIKQKYAITMQLLNALWFGQQHARFTHYDLHPGNVLIKETQTSGGALYLTETSVSFTPLYGQTPIIFDYGYSYVSSHDHKPCLTTLEHAKIGYLPCMAHPWMDTRVITGIVTINSAFTGRTTNAWERWLKMFPRRGFTAYYNDGWEEDVDLGVPDSLGEWVSAGLHTKFPRAEESALELAGDTLCALGKFPFMNRRVPENSAQVVCFERLVRLIRSCITTYMDSDGVGVVYALVRAYINRENLVTIMQHLKREFRDPDCTEPVTKNKAKTVAKLFQELSGYVENFLHDIWQSRQSLWDAKSQCIASKYRSMESIAIESTAHAPEGIGQDLKNLGQVTVYDLRKKTTTVITVPEFLETPAELTLLYRQGEITRRILNIYENQ